MPMEAFFTSEVRPLDQPDHKAVWVWYCSDSGAIAIFTLVVLGLVMGEIVLFWSTQIQSTHTQLAGYHYCRSTKYFVSYLIF